MRKLLRGMSKMAHHDLKTLPCYFQAAWDGDKPFEIRDNTDRGFQKGDTVTLKEYAEKTMQIKNEGHGMMRPELIGGFTGREIKATITYVTNYEQKPGWVVFGYTPMKGAE